MAGPSQVLEQVVDGVTKLRADRYIAEVWQICSRSQLLRRLRRLQVNGADKKPSQIVQPGDRLRLELELVSDHSPSPEPVDLNILYQDADVVVIDKQPGLVVHPAAGNWHGTMVHGLLYHLPDLAKQAFADDSRPGLVHRLDKDTSGLLIVAKNPAAHRFLADQFANRQTAKTYLALAKGNVGQAAFSVGGHLRRDPRRRKCFAWHADVGKAAQTDFLVLKSRLPYHLIQARPQTGRTHQIRVHLQYCGLPIVGDRLYGPRQTDKLAPRCLLHAWKLRLRLPAANCEQEFVAPPPPDFCRACQDYGLDMAVLGQTEGAQLTE